MSSAVDQLPQHSGDPEGSRGRTSADTASSDNTEVSDKATGFSEVFATEVRAIFTVSSGKGLFGSPAAGVAVDDPAPAVEAVVEAEEVVEELDAQIESEAKGEPTLFAAPIVIPKPESDEAKPSIDLFLSREETPERAAPALTGLAMAAKVEEPAAVPNLFVSSSVAPAEVTFVPAEETERRRYLWLLILIGLLLVAGAIWLTIAAQSSNTVDAPVTTVETVPSTLVSTTEAPATTASTAVSTTAAPTTVVSTETTVEAPVTTAAAPVQTTAPARPATTTRRPATTAAPTTAAPTTAATVPDVTFAPPTWSPNTTAAAPEPTTTPPAEPAAEPAAEG